MGTAVDVDFHQIDDLSTKSSLVYQELFCIIALSATSSETQGQIVGARESLNGRENKKKNNKKIYIYVAPILFSAKRLKIWHEEKKRSARRAPGSPPFCLLIGQKNTKVFWHQSEARMTATV